MDTRIVGSTNLPLLVKFYNNATYKDQNGQLGGAYLTVEVNQTVLESSQHQSNPSLVTYQSANPKTGETQWRNDIGYSIDQLEAIAAAAGENMCALRSQGTGDVIGQAFSVNADVVPSRNQQRGGLVINTNTLRSNEFPVNDEVLKQQFESKKAAKAAREATIAARQPGAGQSNNFFTNFAQQFNAQTQTQPQNLGAVAQSVPVTVQQQESVPQMG